MAARILHVIDSLGPSGVARQQSLVAAACDRTDFEVRVVTIASTASAPANRFAEELQSAGIGVDDCGGRWPVDPRAVLRLRQFVKSWQPDLIHSWDRASSLYVHGALIAGSTAPHVTSRRTWTPAHALPLLVDRQVLSAAQAVITSSEILAANWRERGVPFDKLHTIPSGVRRPIASAGTRQALLAELGLPAHARLLACVGRLTVDKRIKDVIWAADLLKVIRDDVHLLIVGDGPHRARLERFRDQVRIADKVHFFGVRTDVPKLLEHCDVLLAAGQTDVQSSSILEAMASGVPVVASDTPGHRELVEHDVTGDLAPLGDRGALTRQTMRVLDDAATAGRLAAAARERVLSNFSTAQLAVRHAEVYRCLLRNR